MNMMMIVDHVFGTERPYFYALIAIGVISLAVLLLYAFMWKRCAYKSVRAALVACSAVVILLNGMLWSCFKPSPVSADMTRREVVEHIGSMTCSEFSAKYDVVTYDGEYYHLVERK